jgi:hypothetical protein
MGVAARAIVGLVLLAAGALKASDKGWRAAAAGFGLPGPAAVVLPWVEVVIGALLVAQAGRRATAGLALALLVGFTVVIAVRLRRGDAPPCACFGALSRSSVTNRTVGRNLVLVALAVVGTVVH